jgi:hypothetical protein
MSSIKDKLFAFFHSKFNLKKKLNDIVVDCFVENQIKAPLFIILKTGDKIELKSGLFCFLDLFAYGF